MTIVTFTHTHIPEASSLAYANYEEERAAVPFLPTIETVPDLTAYADNGLGVAAFNSGQMVGFLCCRSPFDNAFGTTNVKGVFSPMGANAAIKENRMKIYAAMYQAAAAKWVRARAASHAVCLYAHDEESQEQFYLYGFGLRCMDAVRPMELIECQPCVGYSYVELVQEEYISVYPLALMMNQHFCESPFFMNRTPDTPESFAKNCLTENARYFAARCNGELCGFVKISGDGETFIASGADYRHIIGAYCLPEHRSKGVYQNLLNFVISVLKSEGYTRLGVDFESFNPTAYGFWTKYFIPYTHGVVRRIDEHILERG